MDSHPEMDENDLLDKEGHNTNNYLVGILHWLHTTGRADIQFSVSPLVVSHLVLARGSQKWWRKYLVIWRTFLTVGSSLIIRTSKGFPCCNLQICLSRTSMLMPSKNLMSSLLPPWDHWSSLQFSLIWTMPMIKRKRSCTRRILFEGSNPISW